MIKYDMKFVDVLSEILETGGAYQGEMFSDGTYIAANNNGKIMLYKFISGLNGLGPLQLTKSIIEQNYRRVLTKEEVLRKQ